jgi:taurine---2-oxoglutarate transaminase
MATEVRARLGAKLAEITPGDIDTFFFTNGGAEANENAIKLARFFTGRHKIIARYRSYHGATAGAISLTGDPRRWAASRAFRAWCTCSILITASSADGNRRNLRSP